MDVYWVTIRIPAETRFKAKREVELRVPNGQVCSVRRDSGVNGNKRLGGVSKRGD